MGEASLAKLNLAAHGRLLFPSNFHEDSIKEKSGAGVVALLAE